MSDLNYFQIYSQPENHVTNNTLLMLRHVYRTSPLLIEGLLTSLVEDDTIKVGLKFKQQERTAAQVPDGFLSQEPLFLYIEAKLGGVLDGGQIQRHLDAIAKQNHPKGSATLLGLSAHPVSDADLAQWVANASTCGVKFKAITYDDLISELRAVCGAHVDLSDILDDYQTFIDQQGLRPDQDRQLVAFLCGTTHADNVQTGIYYEPEDRSPKWKRARLMGVYHGKRISHVGRINWVVAARRDASGTVELRAKPEFGALPQDAKAQIRVAIEKAEKHYPSMPQDWHRFYVTDVFEPTDFRKKTPGGMMGHRYFDMSRYLGGTSLSAATPTKEIANGLGGKEFD